MKPRGQVIKKPNDAFSIHMAKLDRIIRLMIEQNTLLDCIMVDLKLYRSKIRKK